MPETHVIGTAGYVRRGPGSAGVGASKVRSVRDKNVAHHFVVNIAAKRDDARLIEVHRRIRLAVVERQLEALGWRKRINLMADGIGVRELDRRADRDDDDVRDECKIDLIDD